MPNSRLPKQVLYSQLVEGNQAPGGQRRRHKDNLKTNHINLKAWEDLVTDRATWRNTVREGAAIDNSDLHHAAQDKRRLRTERAATRQPRHSRTPAHTAPQYSGPELASSPF